MNPIYYENLTLTKSGEALTVISCDKEAREVEIPARLFDLPVTAIAERAFEGCDKLVRLTLPEATYMEGLFDDALCEIGEYAFSDCTALCEIEIPESVSVVWRGAFYGCTALKKATFFEKTYFAPYAFGKCVALQEISPLKKVSEGLFYDCKALESAVLLDGCQEIDEDAFEHCEALREVTIPASVQRVEALAFRSCWALTRVKFENPDGWYASNRYNDRVVAIDVESPEENARALGGMDFDDGVIAWFRK